MHMRHILIMGGDARYLHVIESLASPSNQLYLIGFHHLSFKKSNVKHTELEHTDLSIMDAILLPVTGTDEKGKVELTYSDESLFLTKQILSCTPKHCTIYTGTANDYLQEICESANRKIVRLFDRDDVAIYNSIPTAEGALKLAIEATEETIHNSNVCVLGFGRVGKTVARLFHAVGAHVHVAARNSADLARVTEMGLTAIETDQLMTVIGDIAIWINTIPKLVIDQSLISNMPPSSVIIDLASKPGGVDIPYAQQHHIKAIHALGLPGKTAPKTAGEILANTLIKSLNNQ